MSKILIFLISFVGFFSTWHAHSTTFVPITIKKQIQESDSLIEGRVYEMETMELNGKIVTKASVALDRWIGFNTEKNDVEVYFPGGTFGDQKKVVHGAPEFSLGESVVLFLKKDKSEKFWVNNLGLGKFSIKRVGVRRVIVNQIYPGMPEVGQMDFQKFLDLSQWVKKKDFQLRFKDKYEMNHEKTVKHYIKNQGRSIASRPNENHETQSEGLPIYWLVLLFGALGVAFRIARNRSA